MKTNDRNRKLMMLGGLGLGLAMLMLKMFEHGLTQQFHIHEKMAANLTVISLLAARFSAPFGPH